MPIERTTAAAIRALRSMQHEASNPTYYAQLKFAADLLEQYAAEELTDEDRFALRYAVGSNTNLDSHDDVRAKAALAKLQINY